MISFYGFLYVCRSGILGELKMIYLTLLFLCNNYYDDNGVYFM